MRGFVLLGCTKTLISLDLSVRGWITKSIVACEKVSDVEKELVQAQEQLKWIEVKKETPKTRGMVCYKDGSIGTKRGADVTIEECDEWITHWKPLPAPPTKVEGSG